MLCSTAAGRLLPHLSTLSPTLRAHLYQNAVARRPFSASTSRKSTLLEWAIAGPNAAFDALHATGLPWYAVIPMTAIFVRGTLGYYVSILPARRREMIRRNLHPLTNARGQLRENIIIKEWLKFIVRREGNSGASSRVAGLFGVFHARLSYVHEAHIVGKKFGAPMLTWRSFFNFGMLIAFAETIRMRCGAREGLLSLLLGPSQAVEETLTQDQATPNLTPEELLVRRIEAAQVERENAASQAKVQSHSDVGGTSAYPDDAAAATPDAAAQAAQWTDVQLTPLNTPSYAESLDPTLKTEGLAWIQDLTLPDASLALPLAMSVMLAANVLLRPRRIVSTEAAEVTKPESASLEPPLSTSAPTESPGGTDAAAAAFAAADRSRESAWFPTHPTFSLLPKLSFMQRISLSLSVLFFFVAMKLPAAVLLYILPSIATGFVQRRWMDYKYPLPDVISRCRRPLRVKIQKEYE